MEFADKNSFSMIIIVKEKREKVQVKIRKGKKMKKMEVDLEEFLQFIIRYYRQKKWKIICFIVWSI